VFIGVRMTGQVFSCRLNVFSGRLLSLMAEDNMHSKLSFASRADYRPPPNFVNEYQADSVLVFLLR